MAQAITTTTKGISPMETSGISKATATAVAQELEEAAKAIFAKHNLAIGKVATGYGEWFDFKVTAVAIQAGPNGINLATKEAQYYTKFGFTAYGAAPDFSLTELSAPLGTKFIFNNGTEYVFSGIDPKKKKFPICATRVKDGTAVGLPESAIKAINLAAGVAA